ncbi:NUDIX domain-containing protein [Anditalea andensis]|uniref:NUDIX hydrolase n=1 Tax=Anditalea andensis TaxID=1048983 RepID=A0A074KXN4_9BACT|nr:NUDIX domain-containing protein [Anditalea andensis]KEO74736.1 NUDIX hydrolase [Anditalea andensis]
MPNIEKEIHEKFGHRLRVRVNGIHIKNNQILMVKHQMGHGKCFWNVPGGGMEYGTSTLENLMREFREETGLRVKATTFLFVHEFLEPPLHAIELFFDIIVEEGEIYLGEDPELSKENQLIAEISYLDIEHLAKIPKEEKHPIFWGINSVNDVRIWKGNFNFENKCIK